MHYGRHHLTASVSYETSHVGLRVSHACPLLSSLKTKPVSSVQFSSVASLWTRLNSGREKIAPPKLKTAGNFFLLKRQNLRARTPPFREIEGRNLGLNFEHQQ